MSTPRIIFSITLTTVSMALVVTAAVLWHRSYHHVDVLAALKPAGNNQSLLSGVGSFKGALLVGSIEDPQPPPSKPEYEHTDFPLTKPGSSSFVEFVPKVKHGALGFGMSKGELRLKLGLLSFLKPRPRKFEVVYVPYYFLMLVGILHPASWLIRRKQRTED